MFWCGPLWVQLVWDSLCFLDLHVYFLCQIRQVFFSLFFKNKFSICCSSSSPSATPMIWMLVHLKLFHFFSPLLPSTLYHLSLQYSYLPSSCPWIVHIRSLASPFPILFLTSPYFVPTIYASYSLYLFPHSCPSASPLITLHVISISVILLLF